MGYESTVEGEATGAELLARLVQAGFTVEDGLLVDPRGHLTGLVVVDGETIQGMAEWCVCWGYEALVQALRRVEGLAAVDLRCAGEEGGDREHYVYRDGRWYELLTVEACVRQDRMEQARAAVESALAPFGLEGQ